MKKQTFLAAGLVIGLVSGMCVQSFAAGPIQRIAASINDSFSVSVNGENKSLPDDSHILVYNNRSYLPVRAVSEMLGCKVDWDDATKKISITQDSGKKDDGKIDTEKPTTGDDNKSDTSKSDYKALPQIYEVTGFRADAESYFTDEYGDRLYIKLKNKEDGILRLVSSSVKFTVNGKTYTANDALTGYWDTRWYTQYMDKDDELEGYLRLPNELDNFDNFDVYFEVQRDGSTDKYGVNFHIKK